MHVAVRRSAGLLLSLLLWACSGAVAAGTVLVVGDSMSAGDGVPAAKIWVNALAGKVTAAYPQMQVINASEKGDTTASGVSRLPSLLRQYQPDVVVIELGEADGPRGVSLKATRQNLAQMIRQARKSDARVLLLGMDVPARLGAKYVQEFRALYPQVARENGATLLPSFLAGVSNDPDMMQSDGVHPNSLAQPKLADNVWKALAPLLKR